MALFKRKDLKAVVELRKTQTRRTHRHEWKVGRRYALRDRWFDKPKGFILITRKFQQLLGDISLEDVKKEGFESLKDFQRAWIEINGEWNPLQIVIVYEFRFLRCNSQKLGDRYFNSCYEPSSKTLRLFGYIR
jgi:hypothetical protein